nr:tyrosine-type recombinase/integrase [Oceanicella actignis]
MDPRQKITRCLHTDSRREALARAPAVEAEIMAYWEALAAGRAQDAAARWEAARRLCESRGYEYRPFADLARPEMLAELFARLERLAGPGHVAPREEAAAMLGLVDAPSFTMTEALAEFFKATPERVLGKSERKAALWRRTRERAVEYFVAAVGDKDMAEITREDAMAFRAWWQERCAKRGLDLDSANKSFSHIDDVFQTVSDLHNLGLKSPFSGLRFKVKNENKRPPFSIGWIRNRILAPGALDGLNEEARDVLLVMVNTGARPDEIVGALREEFRVGDAIPHLRIRPRDGHPLKNDQSARDVPLLGVSLDAARRIVARGGLKRYFMNANKWTAAAGKYMRENGLRESPAHVPYSLRHSFEDRLLAAGVDERLRIELMGHKYDRPKYGDPPLDLRAAAIAKIAL